MGKLRKELKKSSENNIFSYSGIHQRVLMLILNKYLNNMVSLKNAGKL